MKTFIDKKLEEFDEKFDWVGWRWDASVSKGWRDETRIEELKLFLKQALEEAYDKGYEDCRKFFEMEKDIIMKDYLKSK